MSEPDHGTNSPLGIAIRLAKRAGRLLLEHLDRTTTARLKEDKSVVTEADLAADHLISEEIQAHFPGEAILSEELQTRLSGDRSQKIWVVDPLDGTTNYSLGLPFWGISIARLHDGQPELGVLYFPRLGELYYAQIGQGASFNGTYLAIDSSSRHQLASFFSCCSRTYRYYDIRIKYKPRILGSAAYSLCSIARGIALIAFEATPKIWDIAAGWLLVKEAGGAITTYDCSLPFPVSTDIEYNQISFPFLAAINPELLAEARQKIIRK